MVLKEEQEKLKRLLSEAIPLLCKNGVQFKDEFSIEALIGITLDKDRVMLVSINETVKSDTALSQEADSQADVAEEEYFADTTLEHRPKDSTRRKRKTPGKHRTVTLALAESPSVDSSASRQSEQSTPDYGLNEHEFADKKPRLAGLTAVKQEVNESEEDLVFVKEDSVVSAASELDLSGVLGFDQQQAALSFPNINIRGQQAIPGTSSQAVPIATFQNTSQMVADPTDSGETSTQQHMVLSEDNSTNIAVIGPLVTEGEHYCKERLAVTSAAGKTESGWVYRCLLCADADKPFCHAVRTRLREHVIATHYNVALYSCDICGKRFKHDSSYYRHHKNCKHKERKDIPVAIYPEMPPFEQAEDTVIVDDITGKTLHKL